MYIVQKPIQIKLLENYQLRLKFENAEEKILTWKNTYTKNFSRI